MNLQNKIESRSVSSLPRTFDPRRHLQRSESEIQDKRGLELDSNSKILNRKP